MLTGLLLLVGTAWAGDVLVPTFTPSTMSDFGPSERLTEATLAALAERDLAFVTPSEIQRRAGEVADGCADVPECNTTMWRHFDTARLAVVGSVTWDEGMLRARVRFHGPDDASPIEVISDRFPEDQLPAFAQRVADSAEDLLEIVPPRGAAGVAVALLLRRRRYPRALRTPTALFFGPAVEFVEPVRAELRSSWRMERASSDPDRARARAADGSDRADAARAAHHRMRRRPPPVGVSVVRERGGRAAQPERRRHRWSTAIVGARRSGGERFQ